jgi:hypothetical protein
MLFDHIERAQAAEIIKDNKEPVNCGSIISIDILILRHSGLDPESVFLIS